MHAQSFPRLSVQILMQNADLRANETLRMKNSDIIGLI